MSSKMAGKASKAKVGVKKWVNMSSRLLTHQSQSPKTRHQSEQS